MKYTIGYAAIAWLTLVHIELNEPHLSGTEPGMMGVVFWPLFWFFKSAVYAAKYLGG